MLWKRSHKIVRPLWWNNWTMTTTVDMLKGMGETHKASTLEEKKTQAPKGC